MPVARVQLPDGRVARLEVPDGTTPVQVEAFVHEQLGGARVKKPDAIDQGAIDAMKPTGLQRFGRGFADVGQGLRQLALMADEAISPAGAPHAPAPGTADAYTRDKSEELARYERGRGPDAGFDGMRMLGNLVATAPAMLVPGGQGTLPARIAAGAGGGALASGTMFTPEGESKAGQVALGALVGGALPVAAEPIRRGIGRVADFVKKPTVVSVPQLERDISIRLEAQGLDYNKLTQTVKDSLVADAQKALSSGGTLDDVMLANKAAIEAIGAKPTKASVTRNPKDWQTEKNLRGITGVGEQIAERDQSNAKAMSDYLGALRQGTGGKASTAYEAGESAVNAIKVQDKAKERAVTELYDAFRDSGEKGLKVPETKLTEALTNVIEEIGQDNILPAVQARLKDFGFLGGKRTRYLTVEEADKFNRLLNANNPGHGPESLAIGKLKGALNQSLIEVPGGGEKLLKAREAAAQRFAEQDASKGVSAAIDDVSPDRFVKRFVMDADMKDLRGTLAELGKSAQGKQAVQDVKGHIFDSLMLKATGATSIDDVAGKPFSGVKFSKALDAIAPEKLHQLFTPSELSSLRALQRASKLLTEEVPFSDVNYSKTSHALANLIFRVGSTPMLGKIVLPIIGTGKTGADWLHSETARKQVAEALIAGVGKAGERKALPVTRLERLAPGGAAAAIDQPRSEE